MESLPPKPSHEPEDTPPAHEVPPAAPESSGAPLPEAVPPPPPSAPPAAAVADTVADTAPAASAAPARRRPRGRTSLIISAAALLGVVSGVATGYTIQADRKPTPLPPLSQAKLSYPDEYVPEDEWEPVPAKHDRRVSTDGDLRKLLLDKPDGAREPLLDESPEDWVPLTGYAREFQASGHMFGTFAEQDIRRVAGAEWASGEYRLTTIRLVQFHEFTERSAPAHARGQQSYIPKEEHANSKGRALKGSGNGLYWVDEAPKRKPGYLPSYRNRAVAWRGDIMMDISIYDTRPISAEDIRKLAEQQLERL